jgi:hypothetical protein
MALFMSFRIKLYCCLFYNRHKIQLKIYNRQIHGCPVLLDSLYRMKLQAHLKKVMHPPRGSNP